MKSSVKVEIDFFRIVKMRDFCHTSILCASVLMYSDNILASVN